VLTIALENAILAAGLGLRAARLALRMGSESAYGSLKRLIFVVAGNDLTAFEETVRRHVVTQMSFAGQWILSQGFAD